VVFLSLLENFLGGDERERRYIGAIHHTKAEPQPRTHAHASFEGVMVRTVETEKEKRAREALEATEIAVPLDVRPRRSRPLHRHALTLPLYPIPTSTLGASAGPRRQRGAPATAAPGPNTHRRERAVGVHGGLGARQLLQGRRPDQHPPRHTQVSVAFPEETLGNPPSISSTEKTMTKTKLFWLRRYEPAIYAGFDDFIPDLPDPEQVRKHPP
jgi:hypothetical protein